MRNIDTIWTITNGNRGNEVNCEGVCAHLNAKKIRPVTIDRNWFTNITAPHWPSVIAARFNKQLLPPWPDIVIASSRLAAPYARYIREASKGRTFVAYLQDPQCDPKHFDFVWAPEHDNISGPNVFKTLLSPHKITPQSLAESKEIWHGRFAQEKLKTLAVMIGGPNSAYQFSDEEVSFLTDQLIALSNTFYLIISMSRRTPESLLNKISRVITSEYGYIYCGEGDNPYPAVLTIADALLVTADSVNMTGEACAAGKPVYVFRLKAKKKTKFEQFHEAVEAKGLTRPFQGAIEDWANKPYDDTPEIAKALFDAFLAHKPVKG